MVSKNNCYSCEMLVEELKKYKSMLTAIVKQYGECTVQNPKIYDLYVNELEMLNVAYDDILWTSNNLVSKAIQLSVVTTKKA